MIAAVALAPIVLRVEQGAVEIVGDVSSAVSVAVQDIVVPYCCHADYLSPGSLHVSGPSHGVCSRTVVHLEGYAE